jgi:hypothetical protein
MIFGLFPFSFFLFFLANEVGETTNVGAVIGGRCTIIETNVREEEEAERT